MTDAMTFEDVTTWSGRKRHKAIPGAIYTLCRARVVRPGEWYVGGHRNPATRQVIDGLPSCRRCEVVESSQRQSTVVEDGDPR
jgi:hypothetical protein